MRRRTFIALLAGAAAWPLAARAQQPVRVKRIGLMANLQLRPIEDFRNRLRELGYIEGQNLIVEYRFAEGREERYSDFAAELVACGLDRDLGNTRRLRGQTCNYNDSNRARRHWGRHQYRPCLQSCPP